MAMILSIGEPANEAERLAITHLRDQLPDDYTIVHSFRVEQNGRHYELDLAIIAPHAIYLVDAMSTRGRIDVSGSRWYPEDCQSYTSPLLKLRARVTQHGGATKTAV